MKKEEGVTLNSLVIYIIVMFLTIGLMTSVSSMFYGNIKELDGNGMEILKTNNFNVYFLKEIKKANNGVDKIDTNGKYILFKSGNSFSFVNNDIYYNNLKIISGVSDISFAFYNDPVVNANNDIITVNIQFTRYSKQLNYKVEEIY